MKRKIVGLLAMSLVVGSCLTPALDSQAAKIQMNKKKVTIKAGKKVTLKIKGTKKRAKWSSSKKSVATVSQKGVVKAKKAGKAVITAKIGKKKCTCKVTVKASNKTVGSAPTPKPPSNVTTTNQTPQTNVNSISTDQLAANVDIKVEKILSGVLVSATNRNTVWLDTVCANYSLCTAAGIPVEISTLTFSNLKPGATLQRTIYVTRATLDEIEVSKTTVSKTVDYVANYVYTDRSSSVTVTDQVTLDGDIAYTIKNNTGSEVEVLLNIYYYDAAGKLIDADDYPYYLNGNETKMDTFSPPYTWDDDDNKVYQYKSYKIVATASSSVPKI